MNHGNAWRLALDTTHPDRPEGRPRRFDGRRYRVGPRSMAVLKHPESDADRLVAPTDESQGDRPASRHLEAMAREDEEAGVDVVRPSKRSRARIASGTVNLVTFSDTDH